MSVYAMFAADLVAIVLLVFALFLPRHGRRDLVAAYLGVNVGVMAVASALATSTVGAGLGLGLFGVLSIIRLRSQELAQHEVAYYFAALALGLLGGLATTLSPATVGLMAMVVVAIWVGDHPAIVGRRAEQQTILLDRAFTDHTDLRAYAGTVVPGRVLDLRVVKVDLVNDTTLVELRSEGATRAQVPGDERVGRQP